MENAKTEFLTHIGNDTVFCATIRIDKSGSHDEIHAHLKVGYTTDEYHDFLEQIDIQYDSGFGIMMLHGQIWYLDHTWSTRGEYDGSEWWQKHKIPEIPEELLK